jgi:hypothetical protein
LALRRACKSCRNLSELFRKWAVSLLTSKTKYTHGPPLLMDSTGGFVDMAGGRCAARARYLGPVKQQCRVRFLQIQIV